MDQRGHTSDEQDHGDRQRVRQQANIDTEVACHHPIEEFDFDDALSALAAFEPEHANKDQDRGQERAAHGCCCQPTSDGFTKSATKEHQNDEAEKRQKRHEPHKFDKL